MITSSARRVKRFSESVHHVTRTERRLRQWTGGPRPSATVGAWPRASASPSRTSPRPPDSRRPPCRTRCAASRPRRRRRSASARVADELGYTGNAVARALARGRTGLVGVLTSSLEDLGEQRFVETLGRELGRHDLQMMLVDAQGDPEREGALARQLADQFVDGLVVSPLNPADPVWEEIGEALPVVTVGDALAGPTVGEVLFDNRAGVTMVLEHLHAPRPSPRRRADAEPPLDARPPRGARRRRGLLRAGPRRHRGQRAPFDRRRGRVRLRPAALRPAPDRGLLPLGLDRLRRLRGGRRARARRPRRPLRRRATTATRSPAWSRPR